MMTVVLHSSGGGVDLSLYRVIYNVASSISYKIKLAYRLAGIDTLKSLKRVYTIH